MENKNGEVNKAVEIFKEWGIPILLAFALVIFIHKFLFFNIEVPTLSMYPTIKADDRILVTRVHNTDKLQRGDIVVFHSNKDEKDLIKRLIGLPGDTVEYTKEGKMFINGELVDEPYVLNQGGKAGKFEVPQGNFLFMGDNRSGSEDSRYWENPFITQDKIMGKAQIVIFPFNRFGKLK